MAAAIWEGGGNLGGLGGGNLGGGVGGINAGMDGVIFDDGYRSGVQVESGVNAAPGSQSNGLQAGPPLWRSRGRRPDVLWRQHESEGWDGMVQARR